MFNRDEVVQEPALENIQPVRMSFWKIAAIFLAFEFIFSAVTMPLLIFYGPFENVKKIIVGAAWNTLRHQYVAKIFLSDEAITRLVDSSYAVDFFEQGEEVNVKNFANKHSDKIEIYNIDGGDFKGKLMVIEDPTRLVVGYSSQFPMSGETTSKIAKRSKAVAAVNAGGFLDQGWTGTGGLPQGFILHNGQMIYDELKDDEKKQDTVGFTDKGMLIVGKHSIAQLKKYGIKEAVSFGPPLVVNGKPTIESGDGGWGIAPRTAIGQRADGAVLLLTVDGRRLGSLGATLRDLQDIMLEYKALNAANLDGGSSTTMFYKDKIINKPSDALGERAVASAFLVLPEKGGSKK